MQNDGRRGRAWRSCPSRAAATVSTLPPVVFVSFPLRRAEWGRWSRERREHQWQERSTLSAEACWEWVTRRSRGGGHSDGGCAQAPRGNYVPTSLACWPKWGTAGAAAPATAAATTTSTRMHRPLEKDATYKELPNAKRSVHIFHRLQLRHHSTYFYLPLGSATRNKRLVICFLNFDR